MLKYCINLDLFSGFSICFPDLSNIFLPFPIWVVHFKISWDQYLLSIYSLILFHWLFFGYSHLLLLFIYA